MAVFNPAFAMPVTMVPTMSVGRSWATKFGNQDLDAIHPYARMPEAVARRAGALIDVKLCLIVDFAGD